MAGVSTKNALLCAAAVAVIAALAWLARPRSQRPALPIITQSAPRRRREAPVRAARVRTEAPKAAAAPAPPRGNVRTDTLKIAEVPPPGAREDGKAPRPALAAGPSLSVPAPESGPAATSSARLEAAGAGPRTEAAAAGAAMTAPGEAAPSAAGETSRGGAQGAAETPEATEAPSPDRSIAAGAAALSADGPPPAAMGSVLNEAKAFKAGEGGEKATLEAALMNGLAADRKVDAGLRAAIADMRNSGKPVTPEALQTAAAGVLAANNLTAEDVDVDLALGRASLPEPAPADPAAYSGAVKKIVSQYPDAKTREKILREKPPPEPTAPPPKGAIEAYQKYRDVFERARKEYGVEPQHILAILGVETRWGRVTGDHPLVPTLWARSQGDGKGGVSKSLRRQAGQDLKALTRMTANDELGGRDPEKIKGSYAGAMGVPQFLPSSWESYSRDADGGGRDPFSFPDAVLSVANYLKGQGYSHDVAKSIYGYNHSQAYVNKVLKSSNEIRAGLRGTGGAPASDPEPKPPEAPDPG
ncbi:MAG: lytic murein transglycosylase [Elusimicrobia bacterium]|nr:lytic murein transglycosylase [Elusimicrobiota bacterium]